MATATDSTLEFFSKATPAQWGFIFSQYKEALRTKAARRTRKGGPDELIRMDNWYQEQLPKNILSRKEPHITHDELLQITKWKLMRERYRPNLTDLVRINTEKAVVASSKKAFQRLPNLSSAIGALTGLKGVGPATASAVLAAGFPQHAPFMADECMISTPGVETMDYTVAEYLNYSAELKKRAEYLNNLDSNAKWDPHKIELALWAHFVIGELNSSILENLPPPEDLTGDSHSNNGEPNEASDSADAKATARNEGEVSDNDSIESVEDQRSHDALRDGRDLSENSNSQSSFSENGRKVKGEPPAKKRRI